jgi:predicted transcriptional regulator
MVTDLAHRLFAGDVTRMVSHLLDGCDVSAEELARLKQLIQQRERQAADPEELA